MGTNANAVPSIGQRILVDWVGESDLRSYEAKASAAVTPGMLLARNGDEVTPNATQGAATNMVAELDLNGGTIDDAYAADDTVFFRKLQNGCAFHGLLAAGVNASAGAKLTGSATAGVLELAAAGDEVVGYARYAVDNSAGAAAVRVVVEVALGTSIPSA